MCSKTSSLWRIVPTRPWIAREVSISPTITVPRHYLCRQLAVLASGALSAVQRDQPSASSAWQGMNCFNTVAPKNSALTSLITRRTAIGRVRSTARAVITLAKRAMGLKKIIASLAVLTVLVDRHLIECPHLANAYVPHRWPKWMECATLSVSWTWELVLTKNAWPHALLTPILCWDTTALSLKNQLSLILQVTMLVKSTLTICSFLRLVWACHFLDHRILRACQISSPSLFGFYPRNWTQNHSS